MWRRRRQHALRCAVLLCDGFTVQYDMTPLAVWLGPREIVRAGGAARPAAEAAGASLRRPCARLTICGGRNVTHSHSHLAGTDLGVQEKERGCEQQLGG